MNPNTARIRSFTLAASAICLLAACVGSATGAGAQTPGAPAPAGTIGPTERPTPDAAALAAQRSECERYMVVLSGRSADAKLMQEPRIREFAAAAPDLVTCGAVRKNSEDLCKTLLSGTGSDSTGSGFIPEGPYKNCREQWATFNELRTHPEGRSFMFNDINLQGCRSVTEMAPLCDGIRAAMRSGDPQKCASLGKLESICRAYVTLDTKLCKSGDPNDPYAKNAAADCVKKIQSKAVLAKGLKELAASGPPRERELAKAALGQADACASLEQEAVKACAAATPVPPPPPPAGTSPAAGQTPDARPQETPRAG